MFQIVWWLIIGALAGAVARLLTPGRQPISLAWTIALGLLGSVLGGFISSLLYDFDPMEPGFHMAGLGMSIVGSLLLLGAYVGFTRKSHGGAKGTL